MGRVKRRVLQLCKKKEKGVKKYALKSKNIEI